MKASDFVVGPKEIIGKAVLHFACHGVFDSFNPAFSGIRLFDGILTASEFMELDMNAELTVLSSCETALGRIGNGDEVEGLVRAIQHGGCKTVIASLWEVKRARCNNQRVGKAVLCKRDQKHFGSTLKDLIILKIGGSVVTDKFSKTPKTDPENLRRVSKEIATALDERKNPLIIIHGAGSYGHRIAQKTGIDKGIKTEKQLKHFAEIQRLQNKLNCIVTRYLIEEGIPAIPCQASTSAVMNSGRLESMDTSAIEGLVKIKMVPVLYGVPAYDKVKKCSILSGDQIATYLAVKLGAQRIIFATNVDGVFTSDPNKNRDAKLISEINSENIGRTIELLTGSAATDVTGGMLGKVSELDIGIESQIMNALTPGYITRALKGEEIGTMIKLRQHALGSE